MITRLALPDFDKAGADEAGRSGDPSVAIAFGGGGARGLSHIPVIEALDELGIRPVAVSGSSIGAIMGAGIASGMSGRNIRDHTLQTVGNRGVLANRLWSIGAASMRGPAGDFRLGQFNLELVLKALLPEVIPHDFESLAIPLKVMATDYYGQSEVVLETGELWPAIAASAAIPGIFMPVRINGRIMIDGGVFNPIPYEHLMDLADIVIGVDVVGAPEGDDRMMPNRIDSMFGASQLTMQSSIALKLKIRPPHIFIRPPVNRFGIMDFLKAREILDETAAVKDELKRVIEAVFADVAR